MDVGELVIVESQVKKQDLSMSGKESEMNSKEEEVVVDDAVGVVAQPWSAFAGRVTNAPFTPTTPSSSQN